MQDQKFKYKTNCLHAVPQFSNQVEIIECCKNRTEATVPFSEVLCRDWDRFNCMVADIYFNFHNVMSDLFSPFYLNIEKKQSSGSPIDTEVNWLMTYQLLRNIDLRFNIEWLL